ncbi:hypothetical protein CHLRE_08g362076v5 [Chlamydomonas reinhardtii]|uniref:Uncharacterized protein n=1 Tax=Chlamydomonas reinhardtii TaxID=3055 RepID=A0A2K3DGM4_CHLRE|nr:uncharacterized protein CHLRE_08g362076v5 [Chlamydomonas reinhardtii]PNW79666.1 hypothetical protein CHLRE_08g362076v5 [Chlamydomonas reinhardtii]
MSGDVAAFRELGFQPLASLVAALASVAPYFGSARAVTQSVSQAGRQAGSRRSVS